MMEPYIFLRKDLLNVFAKAPLPSQLHQSTECGPLKIPATETGEILGRTTFRTRPKSPKNPQQRPLKHYVTPEKEVSL